MPDISHKPAVIHPLWVRIAHCLNAIAVIMMIMSGWLIYNAEPVFGFKFRHSLTLGYGLWGALQWHFAVMWLFVGNGLFYLIMGTITGRFKNRFFPLRLKELMHECWLVCCLKLKHNDLTHYNMLQKIAYLLAIADLILLVCSGLVLWKSVQFPLLRQLMGGYDIARLIHFFAMTFIVAFTVVHVVMVAIVPRTLWGMVRGRE